MTSTFLPSPELRDDLDRLLWPALTIGVLLSFISVIGAFFSPGDFFRSYLMGYLFWLGPDSRFARHRDDAVPDGWRLGHHDPANA